MRLNTIDWIAIIILCLCILVIAATSEKIGLIKWTKSDINSGRKIRPIA
jgi:hypothetical protein